ncbi:hypothetical protein MTR67_047631 [Solanum verrucosum]|uniref:RNase H type-1 domain-containing protein n=1 Tax=Solanum verrucosum TaxID=315347 RepID=A0AAF0UZQ7_SOLVR|nr:hypothetical protein MTR67_047631 [Solanum verrucosum]
MSRKLSLWSREHIGNVFDKVREWEAKMLDLETDYIENDNDDLRPQIHKTQSEHTRWLKCEQSILRQRANIIWLEDGDSNTKYFHVVINEKRRRVTVHRIQSENGQWIIGDDQIGKEAVDYFSKIFFDDQEIELHHLDCIDQRVHRDDNNMLETIPNEAEIKEVVFGLNLDSTPGPDGFGGAFYQSCWDIIRRKQKIAFYSGMVSKLVKRTTGWQAKYCSTHPVASIIQPTHSLAWKQLVNIRDHVEGRSGKLIMPPENLVKINTDGSGDAIGRAGTGGICRDHRGKIIMAFARSIGRVTSNMVEAKAALNGLNGVLKMGIAM